MADQQEGAFKVTDRRKFHPDGTPREGEVREGSPAPAEPESRNEAQKPPVDNVVSFPGEAKKQPQPSPPFQVDEAQTRVSTPSVAASTAQTEAGRAEHAYNQARGPKPSGLPEASFMGLVNMLGVEAAMHLGLVETPGEEPLPLDMEAARHLIDTLGMLQIKTRGNLTADEDNLLDNILADLRMQFVAISRRR